MSWRAARRLTAVGLLGLLLWGISSCGGRDGNPPLPLEEEERGGVYGGFADHTLGALPDRSTFFALGTAAGALTTVKFVLPRFEDGQARRTVRFYDSAAFGFHDEWYWFRLMAGAAIPGLPDRPVPAAVHGGKTFARPKDVVAWAEGQRLLGLPLPLDLTFVGDRLYSPRFYDLGLTRSPRALGLGAVLHVPADDRRAPALAGELWAFELEHSDVPDVEALATFFFRLQATLPEAIARELRFISRSAAQEDSAARLPAALRARTLRYSDLVVPGAVEVYATGLTAGRLRLVRRGEEERLGDSRTTDVLIVEDTPDFLPPCAALVTATPQTALSHVALLARNRGIPNAHRGGILDDPNLVQLARVQAPVLVLADKPAGGQERLVVLPISERDFATWRALQEPTPPRLTPVDPSTLPVTIDLLDHARGTGFDLEELAALRPVVGGKAAGLLPLLAAAEDEVLHSVDRPVAITIRPFVEHLAAAGLDVRLPQIFNHRAFSTDARVRRLVLEGPDTSAADFVAAFLQAHAAGTLLGDVVRADGVMGVVRQTPVAPATLAAITDALRAAFGRYATNQGLRFRSSSTVEDLEGFNGAGLYTSNTGYLEAASLGGGRQTQTVAQALRETWASYFGAVAFEERRLARVDHLQGAMGVVVHANFQDALEAQNGVALYTLLPPGHPDGVAVLEVNQQQGALSVTNPPPGSPHLPEVDRVRERADGTFHIERLRGSTLLLPGAWLLDDATLLELAAQARHATQAWLQADNAQLPVAQRARSLTLDFELRDMRAGWPALRSGVLLPPRRVWKQARPLSPARPAPPPETAALPIPRDLLAHARRVERRTCRAPELTAFVTEVLTDATLIPDQGHAVVPFTSFVVVSFSRDVPALAAEAGSQRAAVHTAFSSVSHGALGAGGPWQLDITIDPARVAATGFARLRIGADSAVVIQGTDGASHTAAAACTPATLFATPADFLLGLLHASGAAAPLD